MKHKLKLWFEGGRWWCGYMRGASIKWGGLTPKEALKNRERWINF